MTEVRLKSRLMVQAMLRTCQTHGIAATVARTGDADAGAVLVKQNLMGDGFRVLAQIRSADGAAGWLRGTGQEAVAEAAADAYIARQVARDSDVWVLEIEDRAGRLPFDEKVV